MAGRNARIRHFVIALGAETYRICMHRFTAKDGSQFHCEPMAPQHRNEVILDWLGARDRLG